MYNRYIPGQNGVYERRIVEEPSHNAVAVESGKSVSEADRTFQSAPRSVQPSTCLLYTSRQS